MVTFSTDELLGAFVPIAMYWVYAGFYTVIERSNEKYRLHSRADEEHKNLVTRREVIKGVLFQQAIQATVALVLTSVTREELPPNSKATAGAIVKQLLVAMMVLDSWQYFVHRFMHVNTFLYKHVHSKHHAVVVPYAIGAMYNHPVEGFVMDTVGGALSFLISGMSPRTSIFFFSFATIKTVDDHCGMCFPWNPFYLLFTNNSAYHDVHHQFYGSKHNFSQPFFVAWDKILGTFMPYSLVPREGGGFEARPAKLDCKIN